MSLKDSARKALKGIATTGLSACLFGCDPPPPPLECSAVADGTGLIPYGHLQGSLLKISMHYRDWRWQEVAVTNLTAGRLVSVTSVQGEVTIVIDLSGCGGEPLDGGVDAAPSDASVQPLDGGPVDAGLADAGAVDAERPRDLSACGGSVEIERGSFTFEGTLTEYWVPGKKTCPVKRTFHFDVLGLTPQITEALPLRARQEAQIAILDRADNEVQLEARTPYSGVRRVEWSVTGGEVLAQDGDRMRWRLPSDPGLYQVELVVDYGDDGFALDTLTLEIG